MDSNNSELTAGICINNNNNNNNMFGLIATIHIDFVVVKWNIFCISFLHGVVYT